MMQYLLALLLAGFSQTMDPPVRHCQQQPREIGQSPFLDLPDELMVMILAYLDRFQLMKVPVVCSDLGGIAAEFQSKQGAPKKVSRADQAMLMKAVVEGHDEALASYFGVDMFDLEFNPLGVGYLERSILIKAAKLGDLRIVRRLVKHGSKVTPEAIEAALSKEKVEAFLYLLEKDYNKDRLYDPRNVLLTASKNFCDASMMSALLQSPIVKLSGLETRDHSGQTPIFHVQNFNLQIMQALLEAGANVNAVDQKQQSVLHKLIIGESNEATRKGIVDLFCRYGADVNVQDLDGNTPLHLEVKRFDRQSCTVVTALIRAGADPSIPNKSNRTPLNIASRNKVVKCKDGDEDNGEEYLFQALLKAKV